MTVTFLKRSLFQRILGIPATQRPRDPGCWSFADGKLRVDLSRAQELSSPGGAIRIEGRGLPKRVLLLHGEDGAFHAFHNRCSHLGHRRLDPIPGTPSVQCCSINKSTFDMQGETLYGPAPRPLQVFPVEKGETHLTVELRSAILL